MLTSGAAMMAACCDMKVIELSSLHGPKYMLLSLEPERFTVKFKSTLSRRKGKLQKALQSETIYYTYSLQRGFTLCIKNLIQPHCVIHRLLRLTIAGLLDHFYIHLPDCLNLMHCMGLHQRT